MDPGATLLVTFVMIIVVTAVISTGIHIVKPGEIGFLYKRKKFLNYFRPGFIFGPPIVSRMYRLDATTLHILLKPPALKMRDEGEIRNLETEVMFDIADPSRVPIRSKGLGEEIRTLASSIFEETIPRMRSREHRDDAGAIAKELMICLNREVDKMGFRVAAVRVGNHLESSAVSKFDKAQILSWDDLSRKYAT